MDGHEQTTTVGQLPADIGEQSRLPTILTQLVWLLWAASLGALVAQFWRGEAWELAGLVAVDGLTVVMWAAVTFFSGVVHSYSRRYMAGNKTADWFFVRVFAFTLVVSVLVAADSFALFGVVWLAMGLVMADPKGITARDARVTERRPPGQTAGRDRRIPLPVHRKASRSRTAIRSTHSETRSASTAAQSTTPRRKRSTVPGSRAAASLSNTPGNESELSDTVRIPA